MSQIDKPSIFLYQCSDAPEFAVSSITAGIEEEGIPYILTIIPNEDVKTAAFRAADSSRLSVGIAVGGDEAAVHYSKLRKDAPLFYVKDKTFTAELLRDLGSNAARLVKGIAFKTT
ncbi:MAG: glycerol dehydratase reactivase beta/small subunit family protein [Oscillospiraceae bacterium]